MSWKKLNKTKQISRNEGFVKIFFSHSFHVLLFGKEMQVLDDQLFELPICHSFPSMVSLHFISNGSKPCCYFLGADARNVSSIQALSHQRENVWSSCCNRLDYIWALLSNRCLRCHPLCHYWRFKPRLFYLILVIFLVFPFNSSLLLYFYSYKNLPWKSTSVPWCNQ